MNKIALLSHCVLNTLCELLKPLIHNFEEYKSREIELALILGIDTSPSCSVLNKKAIMTEILIEQLEALNIVIKNKIDMPISGDGKAFLEVLQSVE